MIGIISKQPDRHQAKAGDKNCKGLRSECVVDGSIKVGLEPIAYEIIFGDGEHHKHNSHDDDGRYQPNKQVRQTQLMPTQPAGKVPVQVRRNNVNNKVQYIMYDRQLPAETGAHITGIGPLHRRKRPKDQLTFPIQRQGIIFLHVSIQNKSILCYP